MRSASRPAPSFSPLRYQLHNQESIKSDHSSDRDSSVKGFSYFLSFQPFLDFSKILNSHLNYLVDPLSGADKLPPSEPAQEESDVIK
jgi:hypothetical protein